MTYAQAEAWLNRGNRIKYRIRDQVQRIQHWRDLATVITSAIKDVPTAPSMPSRKVENYAVNIADMEAEIEQEIWSLKIIEIEIQAAIRLLYNPVYEEILTKRYLLGMSWDRIAGQMHYSVRWIMHLKNEAIKEIARVNSR